MDESIEIINKQEFLEAMPTLTLTYISLSIIMEDSNAGHSEANNSDLERFLNQKFDEIFVTNMEKKVIKTR